MSAGSIKKMRLSHLGKKPSLAALKKLSEKMKGRKITWADKISATQKGMHNSPGTEFKNGHDGLKKEKNPAWKGGVTAQNTLIRNSVEYKLWRKAVFERDLYQCIWGGKEHGNKLHADHIKPFSDYPELRFAIDNGRTLCEECHKKTDTFAGKSRKNIY